MAVGWTFIFRRDRWLNKAHAIDHSAIRVSFQRAARSTTASHDGFGGALSTDVGDPFHAHRHCQRQTFTSTSMRS